MDNEQYAYVLGALARLDRKMDFILEWRRISPAELVAILVRTGLQGVNALEIGKQLIQKFGSLGAMARASLDDLQSVRGIGQDKAVTLVAAFTLAIKMAEELQSESPVLDNPEAIAQLLREQNRVMVVETFQLLLLNTRRRLIRVERISQGTLDTLLVHAREVFKSAISARAAAIVLVHNHPSGERSRPELNEPFTRTFTSGLILESAWGHGCAFIVWIHYRIPFVADLWEFSGNEERSSDCNSITPKNFSTWLHRAG